MASYRILHRPWRFKKRWYFILMAAELAGLVPILVLFGIAQPDMYRSLMWKIGYDYGFNSNPAMILYAYANHRPLPKIPFVWSQTLTNLNVALSVVSLFMLLVKMIGYIMKVWYPIVGAFVSTALMAIYTASIVGQAGPDHADPRHPSSVAWYIAKSCDLAKPFGAVRSCMLAKGTFAVTAYMLFIYVLNVGLAIWSMLPNKALDVEDDEFGSHDNSPTTTKQWEMQPPRTPHGTTIPFTPRTQAFHALDRKLPLRYG